MLGCSTWPQRVRSQTVLAAIASFVLLSFLYFGLGDTKIPGLRDLRVSSPLGSPDLLGEVFNQTLGVRANAATDSDKLLTGTSVSKATCSQSTFKNRPSRLDVPGRCFEQSRIRMDRRSQTGGCPGQSAASRIPQVFSWK